MAELLSLLIAAPVAPAVPGMPIAIDGAATTLPGIAPDPFAAFLATAQATPVIAPAQIAATPAVKLPTVGIAEEAEPTAGSDIAPDGKLAEAPDEQTPTPVVDPALSPALAMLSALATPAPEAPRPLAIAKPRADSAAEPISRLPTVSPAAPAAPGLAPKTAVFAATSSPQALAIATSAAAPADAAMIPPEATTPETPAQQPVIDSRQGAARATPEPAPPSPAPIAGVAVSPTASPTPSEATAPAVAADAIKRTETNNAVVAAAAGDVAIVAEATAPVEAEPTQPAKPRSIQARIARPKDGDAAPVATPAERPRATTPPRAPAVVRDATRAEPVFTQPASVAADATSRTPVAQGPIADALVQKQLIIADDGRWLDSLARDIAKSASGETMQFRLEPQNLGSLTVAIAQGSDGTAIRMTAETHRVRDLLVEAQPALVAEARANGLRISETHVDLGGAQRDGNNAGNAPTGGQTSFANSSTGQQTMRQDNNARRQPDLPEAPRTPLPTERRSAAADVPARDRGERFA